jgi:hypothetical protein
MNLNPKEWKFENEDVPDSELEACCFYEYVRESPSIVDVFDGKKDETLPVSQRYNWRLQDQLRMCAPFVIAAYQTGKRSFAEPWQEKSEADRRNVCRLLELPPPAHAKGVPVEKRSLVRAFNRGTCLQRLGLWSPESPCVGVDTKIGVERLVVEIDWDGFDDKEIVESFKAWVKVSRPPGIGEPDRKGRKPIDWRKKLRDLGILRLMHETEMGNMKVYQNAAWQRYRHWPERYWYSAHERALKNFRSLLLFLPDGELPIHRVTKAERNKLTDCK